MSAMGGYAVTESCSKGRFYDEPQHSYRKPFERDRDRIIHSSAFRRLEGKTQVFTPSLNDHYRTRLTHSIEVAQIGRTIARALNLNEDLTEAICLAHDLGHSPFGHAGENILDEIMKDHNGFEHNRQSLRIVEIIEKPYPDYTGLNLMYETRLGLAKHHSPFDNPESDTTKFEEPVPSLEGQIADLADRIAYNCHDLEDGMRSRIINLDQVKEIRLCRNAIEKVRVDKIEDIFIKRIRIAKAVIDHLVSDLIATSKSIIDGNNIQTVEDVYKSENYLIAISSRADEDLKQLETFLMNNFYMSEKLLPASDLAKKCLTVLFYYFRQRPEKMPKYFQAFIDKAGLERAVCDYVSGMTDRYCMDLIKKNNL